MTTTLQLSSTAAFNRSLLDRTDIEKLRHLAEHPSNHSPHGYEVEHRQYGDIRSVYRGYGLDYEESRTYQTGDEMRFMNWRLSARTNELYMKVFREERRPSVFILIDRRQPMRFGSNTRLKVTQAARIATYLGFIAKQQNAPIGGVVLNKTSDWIPESSGDTGIYNLLNQVNSPCPPLEDDLSELSLEHTLRLLLTMLVRGSIVYIISDFHDLIEKSEPSLLQLSEEHQVHAMHVFDELEKQLPNAAGINIVDPTSDDGIYLDQKDLIQERFQNQSRIHFQTIQKRFSQFNIPYIEISTEIDNIDRVLS